MSKTQGQTPNSGPGGVSVPSPGQSQCSMQVGTWDGLWSVTPIGINKAVEWTLDTAEREMLSVDCYLMDDICFMMP